MKKGLLGILATLSCFWGSLANAAPLTYDIVVAGGGWVTNGTLPFGFSGQDSLLGSVTVDNALTGLAAIKAFSFTTGSHTWTLSEFIGPTANAYFDQSGDLVQFSLAMFQYGNTSMYFHSNNTTQIFDASGYYFCNQCVSLIPGIVREVPEPATLALVGLGIVWVGIRIRRERK